MGLGSYAATRGRMGSAHSPRVLDHEGNRVHSLGLAAGVFSGLMGIGGEGLLFQRWFFSSGFRNTRRKGDAGAARAADWVAGGARTSPKGLGESRRRGACKCRIFPQSASGSACCGLVVECAAGKGVRQVAAADFNQNDSGEVTQFALCLRLLFHRRRFRFCLPVPEMDHPFAWDSCAVYARRTEFPFARCGHGQPCKILARPRRIEFRRDHAA